MPNPPFVLNNRKRGENKNQMSEQPANAAIGRGRLQPTFRGNRVQNILSSANGITGEGRFGLDNYSNPKDDAFGFIGAARERLLRENPLQVTPSSVRDIGDMYGRRLRPFTMSSEDLPSLASSEDDRASGGDLPVLERGRLRPGFGRSSSGSSEIAALPLGRPMSFGLATTGRLSLAEPDDDSQGLPSDPGFEIQSKLSELYSRKIDPNEASRRALQDRTFGDRLKGGAIGFLRGLRQGSGFLGAIEGYQGEPESRAARESAQLNNLGIQQEVGDYLKGEALASQERNQASLAETRQARADLAAQKNEIAAQGLSLRERIAQIQEEQARTRGEASREELRLREEALKQRQADNARALDLREQALRDKNVQFGLEQARRIADSNRAAGLKIYLNDTRPRGAGSGGRGNASEDVDLTEGQIKQLLIERNAPVSRQSAIQSIVDSPRYQVLDGKGNIVKKIDPTKLNEYRVKSSNPDLAEVPPQPLSTLVDRGAARLQEQYLKSPKYSADYGKATDTNRGTAKKRAAILERLK